ncbi:MAG: nucleoside 2-deoxyribosyltransferase [Pseudomonadota bacterium]
MKIYLAGPEVFHKDAIAIGKAKRALCEEYGFEGLFPIDPDKEATVPVGMRRSRFIFFQNVNLIKESDICIANISPFKSIDCDVGTAWEIAYAFALRKPTFGYSNDPRRIADRDRSFSELGLHSASKLAKMFPMDETGPEEFDLISNLMLIESIETAGGKVFTADLADFTDLAAFEACLADLAATHATINQRGSAA